MRAPVKRLRGSLVALPTPFRGGRVDHPALRRLVERQIEARTDAVVVAGSTGEGVALTAPERLALVEYAAGCARGRIPVIAGIGGSETRSACDLARAAARAGADALLVTTPSYNKPQQRGLLAHFAAVARTTELPVVLYNIPSRTGVDLLPATVRAITAAHPTVVAIKEAGTSLTRVRELVSLGTLDVLLGEDSWIADGLQLGAKGVIGVVANLAPAQVRDLVHDLLAGRTKDAPERVERLAPLITALFLEPNPAPLKAALARLGLCAGELRLPLVPVEEATRQALEAAMGRAGVGE